MSSRPSWELMYDRGEKLVGDQIRDENGGKCMKNVSFMNHSSTQLIMITLSSNVT